ncbi:MAG: nucleotide sugar dehydrogenase [Acidobacteriaceae bacterium]|nr:nucleotide sugar dehydrogenase [Acidobacteriaceae bacterium]
MSLVEEFRTRIESRQALIGIIGLGYVGLPLALEFVTSGFRVLGFDIDSSKVEALSAGRSYIHRIEALSIVQARAHGFRATSDIAELSECDALLLCVPTPLLANHEPDMSYVTSTVEALAPHVCNGQLVVLESTTWPGTTAELVVPTLERLGPARVLRTDDADDRGVMVAFSPEREDPGNTTTPRRAIPKVLGGFDQRATECAAALYSAVFERTVSMSSPAAAEMTKLLENIYRGVNIALVNELKQLCLAMNLDIWEIIDAAATKPFGFQAFYPGPGIGGHCIPVDPFYLTWRAKQFGQQTRFIELAGEVNEAMPAFVVETTRRALERNHIALAQAKVLVLGVAYKRDLDDLRESPALTVIQLFEQAGADVSYNDPFFDKVGTGRKYALERTSTPLDQVSNFDAVVLTTDHSSYDYAALVEASKLFIDTRNATRGIVSDKIIRC